MGRWTTGTVRGLLVQEGWGASLGYPALVLDPGGAQVGATEIEVFLFESVDLPAHWPRLDTFEGPGYDRLDTTVHTATGPVDAFIYTAALSSTRKR